MLDTKRYSYTETTSRTIRSVFCDNATAVFLDEYLGHMKPDARPLLNSRYLIVSLIKAFEDITCILFRATHACVRDRYFRIVILLRKGRCQCDFYRSSLWCKLESIGQQIAEYFFKTIRVDPCRYIGVIRK